MVANEEVVFSVADQKVIRGTGMPQNNWEINNNIENVQCFPNEFSFYKYPIPINGIDILFG